MNPAAIMYILRLLLCNTEMLEWLKKQAKVSNTPIDDMAIDIIEMLLCPKV